MMILRTTATLFDDAVIHWLACEAVRHHIEPTDGDADDSLRFALCIAGFIFSCHATAA